MKVAILSPLRDGTVHHEFAASLAHTISAVPNVAWFKVVGNSILPDARALCVARALAWGAEKLVFIDDDMSWNAADFRFLVSHPVTICAGAYRLRSDDPAKVAISVGWLDDNRETDGRGLIEIDGAGFGFIRIDREVFVAVGGRKYRSEALADEENEYLREWFPYGWAGDLREGEDIGFCRRARAAGHKVWLDPAITLGHHAGPMTFRAKLS